MQKIYRLILALAMVTLISCGSHKEEEDGPTGPFSNGAKVLLSGTSQKDKININEPVQIIASTQNGASQPSYIAISSKREVANVAANGQIITIIGIKVGNTKVIVIDQNNGNAIGEFNVEVLDDGSGNGGTGGNGSGGTGGDDDSDSGDDLDNVFINEIGPVGSPVTITFSDKKITLQSIPTGRFIRGDHSLSGKIESLPKHSVVLTQTFWMSEFEITNGQYVSFLNDVESSLRLQDGIISGDYDRDGIDEVWVKIKPATLGSIESNLSVKDENKDKPVVDVTWYGAMAFCKWLSSTQNGTYRLPTDAEWEYSVRGNQREETGEITYSKYPWGLEVFDNVYGNASGVGGPDEFTAIAPVKSFPLGKNLLGLYDSMGNVAEWCFDNYDDYTSGEKINPFGDENDGDKVYRGGSWAESGSQMSVSGRSSLDPNIPSATIGFRVIHFEALTDPLSIHQEVSLKK